MATETHNATAKTVAAYIPLPEDFDRNHGIYKLPDGSLPPLELRAPFFEELVEDGTWAKYMQLHKQGIRFNRVINFPVKRMFTDMSFQRTQPFVKINDLALVFNPDAAGKPIVAWDPGREGKPIATQGKAQQKYETDLSVLDGATRLKAMLNMRGVQRFEVEVQFGTTPKSRAKTFADCNSIGESATPFEVYQARLMEEEPNYVELHQAITACGLKFIPSTAEKIRPYETKAVGTLRRMQRVHGIAHLTEVVLLLLDTWHGNPEAMNEYFFKAIDLFTRRFDGTFDRDRFVQLVGKLDPTETYNEAQIMRFSQPAREKMSSSTALAIKFARQYNIRLRDGDVRLNTDELIRARAAVSDKSKPVANGTVVEMRHSRRAAGEQRH